MNILEVPTRDFLAMRAEDINASLNDGNCFIVSNFFSPEKVRDILSRSIDFVANSEESWSPILDDTPSHFRRYSPHPQSKVQQRLTRINLNLWREDTPWILEMARIVFPLKFRLGNIALDEPLNRKPSSGIGYQININHYPAGGGFMAPHTDPIHPHNSVQTLVNASTRGVDFREGGLFVKSAPDADEVSVEDYWRMGDLLCFDASRIIHGVNPVDPAEPFDAQSAKGRYSIAFVGAYAHGTAQSVSVQY